MNIDEHVNTDPEHWERKGRDVVSSRTFQIAVLVFVGSFVLRFMLREHGLWIDEGRALLTAKNFFLGEGFRFSERQIMSKHPFVFYTLIAFTYLFLGVTKHAGIAVVLVLGSLTCVLVFLIGKELFNTYAGIAAAVFMAVNPIHVFYSSRILTDVPVVFFVTLTLYFFVRTEMRDERWSFYATFAAAGLTILTKLTGIVILPTLFLYYLLKERRQLFMQKQYWVAGGVAVGLYGIWEIRTWIVEGKSAFISTALGTYVKAGPGASTGGSGGIIGRISGMLATASDGAVFHVTQVNHTLGTAAVLFLAIGLISAYVYREKDMKIPLLFLGVTFLILSRKDLNRYFMPFVPMALVVAGYGVDRLRNGLTAVNTSLALAVFIGVLAVSGYTTFQYTGAMVTQSAQGFTGLEEAGKWIRHNAPEDAGVIAGSGHQIRFFADRPTWHAANIDNKSEMNRLIVEENYRYIEMDRWESTQPQWFQQYVQSSDAFQPVNAVQRGGQPIVVIYEADPSKLER